jgi:hypothetical protein
MKAKLQILLQGIGRDLLDTWQRSKMVLLAIGAAIIYFEFDKIKEALTVNQAKKEITDTEKKDSQLAQEENSDKQKADSFVHEAQSLSSQNSPVTEDWYEKKK